MVRVDNYRQVRSSSYKQLRLVAALAVGINIFCSKEVLADKPNSPVVQCQDCPGRFVTDLVDSMAKPYLELRRTEFETFCKENGMNPNNRSIEREYAVSRLLHDMVRHNGILDNHYILDEERNARIARIAKKGAVPIGADATKRYPGKMARDLFSEKESYVLTLHDLGSQKSKIIKQRIFSFGDCDEFEMMYLGLLRYFGISARIIMTASNHVETVVTIDGKEFLVDNSFGKFGKRYYCAGRPEYRTGRIGYLSPEDAKEYIDKINKLATEQIDMHITSAAMRRITRAVDRFIKK